ncbi:hypothetical protein CR513_00386, partial [Mucuna pruriens]
MQHFYANVDNFSSRAYDSSLCLLDFWLKGQKPPNAYKKTQEHSRKKFKRMLLNSPGFSIWGTWDASISVPILPSY